MASAEVTGDEEPQTRLPARCEHRQWTPHTCISGITGRLMERAYSALGLAIGNHPKRALTLGLLFYALFLPGFFLLKGDQRVLFLTLNTDFFQQFTLTDSHYYAEYKRGSTLFPEARKNILVYTSNEGGLGSVEFLRAAVKMEHDVLAQVAEYEGRKYGYEDVCRRDDPKGPCKRASLISLLVPDPGVLDGLAGATPANTAARLIEAIPLFSRIQLQMLVGNSAVPFPGFAASAAQLGEWLAGANSCISMLPLQQGEASKQFEYKVQRILRDFHSKRGGPLGFTGYLEATIGSESAEVLTSSLWLQGLTCLAMICYAVTFLASQTRLPGQSQVVVAAVSATLPGLASFAAIGSLGYVGLPLNILGLVAPFLIMAQGVDALFVLVSALKNVGPEADTPTAMSRAVAKGGAAITITGFTSVCAFGTAWLTSTNFPGGAAFNFLLAAGIALSNVGMLIVVPSLLVLGERRMLAGRMDLFPWRLQPEVAEPARKVRQQVGPGPLLRNFITHTYAPLPEQSRIFVGTGVLVFIGLMSIGAIGFSQVESGMPDTYFFKDSSYTQGFMAEMDSHFGGVVMTDMSLLLEQPALHEEDYRRSLGHLQDELSERPDVVLVDCGALYNPKAKLPNGSARCGVFVQQPLDSSARAAQAGQLTALVARAGVPAVLYHKSFPMHVHRLRVIRKTILETVLWSLCAVIGALLLTMPVHMAFLAAANVCCILFSLFGIMGLVGLKFHAMTYITCLMAVGFCVDYTCHVAHCAVHGASSGEPWASRMRRSLETTGYDVLHGCLTAMLGVALLAFAGSAAFRVCCYTALLIIGLGGTYALVTLPALLSVATLLCGPVSRGEGAQGGTGEPGVCSSRTETPEPAIPAPEQQV